MKLMLATPCGDGKGFMHYMASVIALADNLARNGDELVFVGAADPGCPFVRDCHAAAFLKSDCDRFLFVDSDIGFEVEDALELMLSGYDVVGGIYRMKSEEIIDYAFVPEDKPEVVSVVGGYRRIRRYVTGKRIAAGFLHVSRTAFERVRDAYPEIAYSTGGERQWNFFPIGIDPHDPNPDKEYRDEAYRFCEMWRSLGGKVYGSLDMQLSHVGMHGFEPGDIEAWIRSRR